MRRQTLCIPLIPLVLFLCLSGCQGSVQENNLALALRADFLAMDGCSGTMDITADYGERVYEYTVSFSSTQETGMTMVITAPPGGSRHHRNHCRGTDLPDLRRCAAGDRPPQRGGTLPPRCIACVSHCHAVWIHGGNRQRTSGRDGNPPHLLPGARAGTWSRNRDDPVVRPSHQRLTARGAPQRGNHRCSLCIFFLCFNTKDNRERIVFQKWIHKPCGHGQRSPWTGWPTIIMPCGD